MEDSSENNGPPPLEAPEVLQDSVATDDKPGSPNEREQQQGSEEGQEQDPNADVRCLLVQNLTRNVTSAHLREVSRSFPTSCAFIQILWCAPGSDFRNVWDSEVGGAPEESPLGDSRNGN